jgi:hypothetical protein
LVLAVPKLVHLTDNTDDNVRPTLNSVPAEEIDRQIKEMVPPAEMPKPP